MNPLEALGKPLEAVVNGVSNYVGKRQERKAKKEQRKDELAQAKHQAQVERIKDKHKATTDYDLQVLENSKTTVMDEVLIFWVMALVSMCFFPVTAAWASAGFATLATLPLWFQLIVVGSFISKLGLRFLFTGRSLFGKVVS